MPADMRVRLLRMAEIIEEFGLSELPRGWVKPLGDRLRELRLTGKDGIARALYVTATGQRFMILRIFVKKTRETPKRGRDLARKRTKEIE